MADISDVEKTIGQLVEDALYPNGTSAPSVANVDCRVVRGWPVAADLDAQMAAGKIMVSVFPMAMERNTTRFFLEDHTVSIPAPTITATISGQTITFGGTVGATENVGVTLGAWAPGNQTFVYQTIQGDTLTNIAAQIAALMVAAGIAATSSGPVLTLPATVIASAIVGVFGTTWKEFKRQERAIMVTLWCPTPDLRDLASSVVDLALVQQEHLLLPDGSGARMVYQRTNVSDARENTAIYRRDLVYMVEYGTNVITTYPQIISTKAIVTT